MSRSGLLQIPSSTQLITGLKEMEVVFSPENISSANAITMRSILYFIVKAIQDGDVISPDDFSRICRDLDDPADLNDADDEDVLLQCVIRFLYGCGIPTVKLPQRSNRFLRLSQAVKPLEFSPDPGTFLTKLRDSNRRWEEVSNQFTVFCKAKRVNGEPPTAEVPDATRIYCSSVLGRLAAGFVADAAYNWLSAFGERVLVLTKPVEVSTSQSSEASGVAPSPNDLATERLSTMQHEKYFNELKSKVNELSLHNTYVNSAPQEDLTDLRAFTQAFFSLSTYMMDQVRSNAGSKWREKSTAAELRAFMIKCIHEAASSIAPFSAPTGLLNIRWADTTLSPLAAMEYLLLSLDEIDDLADSLRIFVVETSFYQGMEVNNQRGILLREIKRAVADNPKLKAYPSLEVAKWSDYASVMRFEVRRVCFTDNRDVYSLEPSRDELLVLNPSAVMKRFKAPSPASSSSKRHYRSEASGDARGDGRNDNRNENRADHTKSSFGSNSHSHGGYYNATKPNGTSSHQGNQPSSTKVDNQSTQQTVPAPSISSSPLHKPEIKHYSRNFSIQIVPHDHEYTNLTATNTPHSIDKTQLPWRIDDPLHPLFNPVATNLDQSIKLESAHPGQPDPDYSDLSTQLRPDNLVTLELDDWINSRQYDSINLINTLTRNIAPDSIHLPDGKLSEGTLLHGLDFVSSEEENDLLSQRYVDNRRSLPRWVGEIAGESVILAPDTQSTSSFISIKKLEHLAKLCPDIKRLQATTHAISAHGEGIHPTVLIPIKYDGNTVNVITSVLPHLPEDIDILLGYSDILRFVGSIANSSDLLGKPYFPPDIEPNNITAVERWEDVEIPNYIHDLLTINANLPPSSYVTFPNSELKLEFIDGGPNLVKSNHRHLPYDRASAASEIAKEWESYNWVDRISGRAESLCGVVLAPKPNGTFRLCIDTSELNLALRDVVTDIPEVADIVAGMANKKYFSQLDMTSAFMQLRLHPESIGKICFKIGNEVYL